MPRVSKELSALDVKRVQHDGRTSRNGKSLNMNLAVGGVSGLLLQVTPNNGKTWLLRTTVGNRRREIGLGGYPDVPLAKAREIAREQKNKIQNGIDPVEERKAQKAALIAAQRRGLSFANAVDRYLDAKLDAHKNAKHRQQWRNTLTTHAVPELGSMLVDDITVQDVLRVLEPIWRTKTETASRLRGRIEAVLSWATVAGHRSGDNPARWANNLKELLPAPSKIAKTHNQPALKVEDAQRWISDLQNRDGLGSRALEFLTLTATRSQEVRGARWSELDLDVGMWIIPADRTKMKREHRVPLSKASMELLQAIPRFSDSDLVFPAPKGGQMSDMTLSATMKRLHETDVKYDGPGYLDRVSKRPAVPHGLRSTFRDWVAECTSFPGDMAEVALAHKINNSVEAAYRRGDMLEKRRTMMDAWADFLVGKQHENNVVEIHRGQQ
ncbi:site-specific integrase [uncultured Ruegeria sp.]|uniref:tyrosine-type recombinase/integrase n=1 Tax=uncultured Ruegeria sp. TaxID=259304 RepID=UPI002627A135|nr:site-specific integrase [uncultured Ruegeria sp.]